MLLFPPCKINLGLRILRRRSDGYHDLETCFYPVPWTDILEVVPSSSTSLITSGIPLPGVPSDNLCLRAYESLVSDFRLPPVTIYLHKVIPLGAGLGGGSSDGVAVLKALNELFSLDLGESRLRTYATRLGSDCAFFVSGVPQLGEGRGEVLSPIDLSLRNKFLVVVKPPVSVPTASAYSWIRPSEDGQAVKNIVLSPVQEWRGRLTNDFEGPVFERFPELSAIKESLYGMGAEYAAMSGSGSALYGIFSQPVSLPKEWASWPCWSGYL